MYLIKSQKYNLVIESVCAYVKYCDKLIKLLHDNNFKIIIYGYHINDIDLVKKRVNDRFLKTGRYISDDYIENTHKNNLNNINKLIEKNKNILEDYEINII